MKNKLLKGACLCSALFATSLVSCSKSASLENMHTEIQANFYNQMFNLTLSKQIKNRALWKRFVDVYRWKEDDSFIGVGADWRCEYWGKMMRGAVLCYRYCQDDELYDILTETVKELLSIQEENGRFSSYSVEKEFKDWDIWGRKYIMTSLLHYYEICKDNALKDKIITALKKHADYIVSKIGEGKLDITRCGSEAYNVKGLNASTILEPFVNLYEVTKEQRYLDFAKYIIDKGGTHVGNMIDALRNDNLLPDQYPIHKAYETLSFFEGVYRYARVIDDKDLINLVIRFFEKVYENEITVIGGAGNHEEDFDHSITSQIYTHDTDTKARFGYGIETCVTVTWMRVLNVLYENTHDIKYYNRFTQSAMNAFLGSVNLYNQKNYTQFNNDDSITDGLPFDSYSPLCYDSRGLATGGLCKFKPDASFPFYGCCVCIAPASVGLMGINYARQFDNKLYLNDYYSSEIKSNKGNINIGGTYLYDGKVNIILNCDSTDELLLRIPEWANNPKITINNEIKDVVANSYYSAGSIKNIKNITLELNPIVEKKFINDDSKNIKKHYFVYGPHVLALDEYTNRIDFPATDFEAISGKNISPADFTINAPIFDNGELVRFTVPYNGKKLVFTNYASTGRKHYKAAKVDGVSETRLTVFLKDN